MMLAGESDANMVRRGRGDDHASAQQEVSIQVASGDDDKHDKRVVTHDAAAAKKKKDAAAGSGKANAANGPRKILFLDGVRGIASILVVTEHTGFMGDVNLGNCAVDMFFVLSSFLLTWLFYKKSEQMVAQQATLRKWFFMLVDYFSKRFMRVYPLFAAVAVFLWVMPFEYKKQFFLVPQPDHFDLYKVLTFEPSHRYHVFWTLPLEITYYFLIPIISLVAIGLGRGWWVPCIPLFYWIWSSSWYGYRGDHMPLWPHLPTFVCGSLTALVYVKIDSAIKRHAFEFTKWQVYAVRAVEFVTFWLLLSVSYRALFFHWFFDNPAPVNNGARFISFHVTILIIIEMILPSSLSTMLEWNVFRYWGKIGFSVYLLHSFVIYSDFVRSQTNYYDKLIGMFFLIHVLGAVSFHLIEHPCQMLSARISKVLADMANGAPVPALYKPVATVAAKIGKPFAV